VPRLPDATIEHRLDTWPIARLATLAPGGAPHLVPIVFARVAGALWSPIDGKPKSTAAVARLRNIENDPRAGVLLDHYDADWTQLWWIRLDATAAIVGGHAEAELALRNKYSQYRDTPLFRQSPTLLRLTPIGVVSWSATEVQAVGDEAAEEERAT
jgi:PPOX class probable F420-dependent enzyme